MKQSKLPSNLEIPSLEAATAMAPLVRSCAGEGEERRRLPATLVTAFKRAGFFQMFTPRSLGGPELDPLAAIRIIEEVSKADAAAGWCVMIAGTSTLTAAYLPPAAAREIYHDREIVIGGVLAPNGRAIPVDGGYRVSGRWPFGSGCQHCDWLVGSALIMENGAPRMKMGVPEWQVMHFPIAEVKIVDTWTTSGLRGTGSHDFEVDGIFVPGERAITFARAREQGPLYKFPLMALLACGVAAVPLGIARSAIGELTDLAAAKTPTGSRRKLGERPTLQTELAQAEGILGSARDFLYGSIARAWEKALSPEPFTERDRANLRIAAAHAAIAAARVVDMMYNAGGGTSIYETSPLQRHFRDVHAATQHRMVAPAIFETAGRVLLNLETDTSLL